MKLIVMDVREVRIERFEVTELSVQGLRCSVLIEEQDIRRFETTTASIREEDLVYTMGGDYRLISKHFQKEPVRGYVLCLEKKW
jgi:hypothetical protein